MTSREHVHFSLPTILSNILNVFELNLKVKTGTQKIRKSHAF